MKLLKYSLFSCIAFIFTVNNVYSQYEDFWEDFLLDTVPVENPVYRPVLGLGGGVMSYWGDIKNEQKNIVLGQPAVRFSASQYADNKNLFKLLFVVNFGYFGANSNSTDTSLFKFSSFNTQTFSGGIGFEYGFGHFFKGKPRIRPFISAGIQYLNFTTLGDLKQGDVSTGLPYYAWSDGTIRNYSESTQSIPRNADLEFYFRDSEYETNLRSFNNYSQQTFIIPVDAGLDFSLSERATLRFGTTLNLTGTDFLDGFQQGNNSFTFLNNDKYLHTYFSFHYDIWSDDETLILKNLVFDASDLYDAIDYEILFSDEDYDMVFDFNDECPNTPPGFTTADIDSVGCPFDDDNDGVPNYLDKERNTQPGAFVNKDGVTLSDDELIAMLDNSMAINREDVFRLGQNYRISRYAGMKNLTIPEKYKFVDFNGDGYISFYEMLNAIDQYFDYNSPLTADDLRDLNDFFFAQ